ALREAASEAEAVHARADAARRRWEELAIFKADALTRAAEVRLDLGEFVEALSVWVQAASIADLGALADHLESASGPLRAAVVRLRGAGRAEVARRKDAWHTLALREAFVRWRDAARAELARRKDAWQPLALGVMTWLGGARAAVRRAADLK